MALKGNPTMKIKRRYLLLEADSKEEVERAILDYIGILGWAKAVPFFIDNGEKIILAIYRKEINNVRAAFELFPGKIKVLKVSGTLKGLKK